MLTGTSALTTISTVTLALCSNSATVEPARPPTHARGEVHRVIGGVPESVTLYDPE